MKTVNENQHDVERGQGVIALTYRQASWGMAILVVLFFFVFITGYFLGKQKEIEDFSNKVERDSLADTISASLYIRYDGKESNNVDEGDDILEHIEKVELVDDADAGDGTTEVPLVTHTVLITNDEPTDAERGVVAAGESKENVVRYYAELIGFGTEKAAMAFVKKLAKDNINTEIKAKTSKTAKGKKIIWYQVVTEPFSDNTVLMNLVQKLEKKEHLKGVSIQIYA